MIISRLREVFGLICFQRSLREVKLGSCVRIGRFVNLYECEIGQGTMVGPFVEIQRGVIIGSRCKIQSHAFLCEGVVLEDEVFIGHGVCFTNDRFPRSTTPKGKLKCTDDWRVERTLVRRRASIGSGATILPGIEIGEEAMVGAGSIFTHDVPARHLAYGNPARIICQLTDEDLS